MKKSQKGRSCDRGYPCGRSCISRKFGCKKKLTGQASTYAGWLKKQGTRLSEQFEKEAGIRLGRAASSLRAKANPNSSIEKRLDEFLSGDVNKDLLRIENNQIEREKDNIKRLQEKIKRNTKALNNKKTVLSPKEKGKLLHENKKAKSLIKKSEKEIKETQSKIEQRKREIDSSTPKNVVVPFSKRTSIEKELSSRIQEEILKEKRLRLKLVDEINKRGIKREEVIKQLNQQARRGSPLGKAKIVLRDNLREAIAESDNTIAQYKSLANLESDPKKKREWLQKAKDTEAKTKENQKRLKQLEEEFGED